MPGQPVLVFDLVTSWHNSSRFLLKYWLAFSKIPIWNFEMIIERDSEEKACMKIHIPVHSNRFLNMLFFNPGHFLTESTNALKYSGLNHSTISNSTLTISIRMFCINYLFSISVKEICFIHWTLSDSTNLVHWFFVLKGIMGTLSGCLF